jgi:acyl-CoA thioester hydrolase
MAKRCSLSWRPVCVDAGARLSRRAEDDVGGLNELGGDGLEVWRGGVNTWECDEMGHLNVRFYVSRAMEGLVTLAAAIGLPDAFRANAGATLLVKDQHIRFLREARPRAALHMVAGILDIGECEARILQLLIHTSTGEIAASFQTVVVHTTAHDERPFPWSAKTRAMAESLMVLAPEKSRPRSLDLNPPSGSADLAAAERLGLVRLGSGAVSSADCDVFGRARIGFFIGRVSDGVPALAASFRGPDAPPRAGNIGGAVLEYRIAHRAHPKAGDRFEIRSGLAGVDTRTQRIVHWMLDPATGQAWGSAEAVAVALDLDARKIVEISEADRHILQPRVAPGLRL